jgi:hypothetical protein
MRSRSQIWIALALLAVGFGSAGAQSGRNAAERANDRREIRSDRVEMREDREDRTEIDLILADFVVARKTRDRTSLARLDDRVLAWIHGERGEAGDELVDARAETGRDRREIRSDRRELRRDRRQDAAPAEKADDRRDLRDDRRDLRDDRRDARREGERWERLDEIEAEWLDLAGTYDPDALTRRAIMLQEMKSMAREEIRDDARETREDRRERREDRRETREDRRQG